MKKYYLTPGPSELYFTVPDHIQTALKEDICSISHRSQDFKNIYAATIQNLKTLLGIPDQYHVVFTASATEVWERLLQNCLAHQSYHFVNGSFSKRFYQFAQKLGYAPIAVEAPHGKGFDLTGLEIPPEVEMIAVTQNETSTGVAFDPADIHALKQKYPDKLLTVDAVSSIPFVDIDYSMIDSLYFSVQKGMGLPAGLGVWIFNDRCAEKAAQLEAEGRVMGTYHTIKELLDKGVNNQTPETPNVLNIYLLGKVCEDMLRRGIKVIRQETMYKSVLMYQLFEQHPGLSPFVAEEKYRSRTVMVGQVAEGKSSKPIIEKLAASGIITGGGYGPYKERHIRIANFPTHSREIFERVVDLLQ